MTNYNEVEERMISPDVYKSEREQMATVMDMILSLRDAEAEGKTEYTSKEVIEFLCSFIKDKIRQP